MKTRLATGGWRLATGDGVPAKRVALETRVLVLALCLLAGTAGAAASETTPEALFEEAYYKELALADLPGALEGYRAVLRLPGVSERVAARAELRIGILLHLRGDKALAQAQLEGLVARYPGETEVLKSARRYLGQPVLDDPAVFMPEDVLLYAELVDPRENIRGLSTVLEGTPFQNPIDFYVSGLARSPSEPARAPEPRSKLVPDAAAFFNEGFLREMQKIEAFAVAIPGEREAEESFLAVLLPGSSDILRGLVQMGLTLSGAAPVGTARDTAIFRLPGGEPRVQSIDAQPHMALNERVIIFGAPRALVEAAVERGAGRMPSLAGARSFQEAKRARAGSILFSYWGPRRAVEALRKDAPEMERPLFDAIVQALGIDRFQSLSLVLSRSGPSDAFHVQARARIQAQGLAAWDALASEPVDLEVLRAIPSAALGFLATRFDGAPARVEALHRAARPVLDLLRTAKDRRPIELIDSIHDFLASDAPRALLEETAGFAAGAGPEAEEGGAPALFFVLRLRDPASGPERLEAALAAVLHHIIQNAASREFLSEKIAYPGGELQARYVEPVPGLRIRYARVGECFVVSPSERWIGAAAAARAASATAASEPLPPGASKVLFLRPADILKSPRKPRLGKEAELILSEVSRLSVSTQGGPDLWTVDFLVPDITPTVRGVLNKVAEMLAQNRAERRKAREAGKGE